MKKLFSITLAIMLVLGFASISLAGTSGGIAYSRDPGARLKIEVLALDATPTLNTTITSNNHILGFTYTDSSAGIGTLYDRASVPTTSAQCIASVFAEIRCAAGSAETLLFPLPRNITNGLVIQNGASTGTTIVYYE